jgi:hypothetical protein
MNENTIDDSGVTQKEARFELQALMLDGFDGDIEKAALALGRETEELKKINAGDMQIDDDLAMKIRRLTQTRVLAD